MLSFSSLDYDELERNTEVIDRDGTDTTLAYDAAGNVTNQVMPGGLKWVRQFDSASRLVKEFNASTNTLAARTNFYAYDAAGHRFAGFLQTRTDGRGVVCTYGYDERLRTTTNAHAGSLAEHNLTVTFKYDARSLMTSVT